MKLWITARLWHLTACYLRFGRFSSDSCGLNLKELSIVLGMDNCSQHRATDDWKIGYICADVRGRNWTSIEHHFVHTVLNNWQNNLKNYNFSTVL